MPPSETKCRELGLQVAPIFSFDGKLMWASVFDGNLIPTAMSPARISCAGAAGHLPSRLSSKWCESVAERSAWNLHQARKRLAHFQD
jgi:hypothetical protein